MPFSSLVGGHLTHWKGHLTITKRSLWITRSMIHFVTFLFITYFGGHLNQPLWVRGHVNSPGPKKGTFSRRIATWECNPMVVDDHPLLSSQVWTVKPSSECQSAPWICTGNDHVTNHQSPYWKKPPKRWLSEHLLNSEKKKTKIHKESISVFKLSGG